MLTTETPIQKLSFSLYDGLGVDVLMKRDDLIHPFISGNKWRKLKYNLRQAKSDGKDTVLTFGGAYSNHLIATACACASNNFKSIGVVRGDELGVNANHVLRLCAEYGMELRFVSRSAYKDKDQLIQEFTQDHIYAVPEGGDNALGSLGCEEILPQDIEIDHIVVPVGTGTTFVGLINAHGKRITIHGIAALNQAEYLIPKIEKGTKNRNWILHTEYAFGGFGKFDQEQLQFNQRFASETGVLLDPVYTGKMMRSLPMLLEKEGVKPGQRILCVHTGGLTGVLTPQWLNAPL